ncbi:MAG: UDP-N-acetylmuramate dehydrogenase [Thermoleophilia bacterium]|nr:UDP-N-acetylmuramate dehydrogenase [Thermoleophilia bacterium]
MTTPLWEEGIALSRCTTIGTGGPAARFARPASLAALEQLVQVAAAEGLPLATIGLGSNLLAADEGVGGIVLRLEGELAAVHVEGERLVAGGGAANAVCLHAARGASLGGLEFACAIPGTIGGGIAMNAGAYGSDFALTVERALVMTADGADWLGANDLAFAYRTSAIRPGWVVARAELRLERRGGDTIRRVIRALVAERKATQPTNRRTFGSVFKNPAGERGAGALVEACGLKSLRVGGALISPVHANFIENAGGATTADCLAVIAEARRRVRDEFGVELETEVRLLG